VGELRVLVVDDDPWILRMVSASLGKKGNYVVDTARDGQQALQRVQANPPALIVTDVMMPVMDGWTLVQRLRSQPAYANIPVLFLTALGKDESRLQMLGLAPQDYICKPFRFEELERRVAQSVGAAQSAAESNVYEMNARVSGDAARIAQPATRGFSDAPERTPLPRAGAINQARAAAQSAARPQRSPAAVREAANEGAARPPAEAPRHSALDGRLEQLGLSSLLVMMEMERKDGVLSLWEQPQTRTGRIFLRQGRVVHARVDQDPSLAGRESVYAMLCWKEGRFSFNAMEVEMEDTVNSSTTGLLMEGARLIDEANRDG
jgi:CheY-like chemotaxis protein